jgi:hypothetical protein
MTKEMDQKQDLQKQIQGLQNELGQLITNNQAIWELLVQIGNRLQRSSTSVKTAVSSLLDYDIFWDETTQYEFLQAIDSSTDELANLTVLITLAFRSQAKMLEIEPEPNSLQEILVTLRNTLTKNDKRVQINIQYPPEGKPALVDYQYLSLALGLLIEVIFSEDKEVTQLSLSAREDTDCWYLQIEPLNPSIGVIIHHFFEQKDDIAAVVNQLLPESALKLMTACRILYLQQVKLCEQSVASSAADVCLHIPTAVNSSRDQQL